MNSREKVKRIFTRNSDGEGAFWIGNPNDATVPIYAKKWGLEPTKEALYSFFDDDCRWIAADSAYRHPEGQAVFDISYGTTSESMKKGAVSIKNVETVAEVEKYPWPDAKYCDFTNIYKQIEKFPDKMVFTGMWSSFFHIVADFFGMENYFMKMYDNPAVVEAVTEKVVDFYVEANEKFFAGLGDRADVMFFGNDLGTQLDLFISLDMYRKFVLPSHKRLIDVGRKYNKIVMLHSCGSIYRIIPDLIEAGLDVLHPIQAQAKGMSAAELKQYKNVLSFLGGIDAQTFFVDATPEQIKEEVRRVRGILSPNIVISPSHEAILPNVPPENVYAMVEAAKE